MVSRHILMHTLALHAGLEVHAPYTEADLRTRVDREYTRCTRARLKQWSKIELVAMHILLAHRANDTATAQAAAFALIHGQTLDPGATFNPVGTALAYLALCHAAPDAPARHVLRARLLTDQHTDGTWRFCTSDVWDTSLIVRGFRQHPAFARTAMPAALRFLQRAQNDDGGWPFRSHVESDNDTTGAVMLALRGTPEAEPTVDRALAYLARVQMDNALWRTWHFRDDPPVTDVVAHVLSALDAHADRHTIPVTPARQWLAEQVEHGQVWAASWYHGLPYAVAEIGRALGPDHPVAHRGIDMLAETQQSDGGWAPEPGADSTASATGLALSAIVDRHPRRIAAALQYLVEAQRPDGTWPGTPTMYGPRPLLSHFATHTQAFVVGGLVAALARPWPHERETP